jgi:hypothetical protein
MNLHRERIVGGGGTSEIIPDKREGGLFSNLQKNEVSQLRSLIQFKMLK